MYPWKLVASLFEVDDFRRVVLHNPVQHSKAAIIVFFYTTARVKAFFGNVFNSFGGKIRHCLHLKGPAGISSYSFLILLGWFGFGRDHYRGSVFTTSSSFKISNALSPILRIHRGKKSFIHFSQTGKNILLVPGTNYGFYFLHKIPNGFLSFVSRSTLDFFGRKALLEGIHQVRDNEPHPERKIGILYFGSAAKICPGSKPFALKLFNRFHPVTFCVSSFSLLYTYFEVIISKGILAGLLVLELFDKFYKLYIQVFESKLSYYTITNLFWVSD